MTREKRKLYRIIPGDDQSLTVSVELPDGATIDGEVVDVTVEGAGARFGRENVPELPVGTTVKLTFVASWLPEPLILTAQTRRRQVAGEYLEYRYGFEFDSPDDLKNELSADLFSWFNRRRHVRVDPDPKTPVEVTLRWPVGKDGQTEASGRLANISISGIGVRIDASVVDALSGVEDVEVAFRLPGSQSAYALVGDLRNRIPEGDQVRLGIEFDPDRCQRLERQQDEIFKYVLARQRETVKG